MTFKLDCEQHDERLSCARAFFLGAYFLLGALPALCQIKPTKRVLIFNELGLSSPGVAAITQEIRAAVENDSSYHIELYSEYLETTLFPEEESQREFRTWYIHKYRGHRPDVMVAVERCTS